jgi:hypothetical protein
MHARARTDTRVERIDYRVPSTESRQQSADTRNQRAMAEETKSYDDDLPVFCDYDGNDRDCLRRKMDE